MYGGSLIKKQKWHRIGKEVLCFWQNSHKRQLCDCRTLQIAINVARHIKFGHATTEEDLTVRALNQSYKSPFGGFVIPWMIIKWPLVAWELPEISGKQHYYRLMSPNWKRINVVRVFKKIEITDFFLLLVLLTHFFADMWMCFNSAWILIMAEESTKFSIKGILWIAVYF